jgi:hypothetical protein
LYIYKIITNKIIEAMPKYKSSCGIVVNFCWNIIAFFNTPSAKTKGLYWAMLLTDSGMLSKGRIKLERNKKIEPVEIEAKVAVSSDLNR